MTLFSQIIIYTYSQMEDTNIVTEFQKVINYNLTEMEIKYISSLNEKEQKAIFLAKNYVGDAFSIINSNGYIEFVNSLKSHNVT